MAGADDHRQDENESDGNRVPVWLVVLGLCLAVAVVVVLLVIAGNDDPDEAADPGDRGKVETTVSPTDASDAPASTPPTTPAEQIPPGTIDIAGPGGSCAAVIARLEMYSAAAKASTIPELQLLFERLSQFESEIFTYAPGEAWSDRVIEQLVVVRRGWVDAGSTFGEGDEATAQQQADDATALLDEIIAGTACPAA